MLMSSSTAVVHNPLGAEVLGKTTKSQDTQSYLGCLSAYLTWSDRTREPGNTTAY